MDDEEYDPLRADPPRIKSLDMLPGIARLRIGNRVYIHASEELPDGRVIGYLGISKPKNTSQGLGTHEMSFINYAPVGAVYAEPDGDEWIVRLPDLDAVNEAAKARMERENAHRTHHSPAVQNLLDDRVEMHRKEVKDMGFNSDVESLDDLELTVEEAFFLGRAVGMHRMAQIGSQTVERRLEAAYRGERRWHPSADDPVEEARERREDEEN